jgi:hypothetical protein
MAIAVERELCEEYVRKADSEVALKDAISRLPADITLAIPQGFEERTCGVLQTIVAAGAEVRRLLISQYARQDDLNDVYAEQFRQLAQRVAPNRWGYVANHNDGEWVCEAVAQSGSALLVDITGTSNRAMFRTLDILANCGKKSYVAYTEAKQYWPKKNDWETLRKQLRAHESIAELVDKQPWLFSYEHRVELIAGHEGYDASGTGRALVAFLPYKCSRLAAVLAAEDYSDKCFLVGRPPALELAWRVDALKEINESLTRGWKSVEMSTFGYKNTVAGLSELLFREDSLLWKYDVHLAAIGSKLQTIGSWAFSCLVPSITSVTSVPSQYYREAFSDGTGTSWVFELTPPFSDFA